MTHTQPSNPILPNIGLCDPQVRVFNGRVYLYATHDYSPDNDGFRMDDWWLWSSDDLVHWNQESTLRPEETYLGRPFTQCWATDAATRDGKFFWYFSGGPEEIGVVEADTPIGPWRDPLGQPIIARGLSPTDARDPGLLMDDDGRDYIVFGTWDFYLARLNPDMISLAEPPCKMEIDHEAGPYGDGKTDDKAFLHKYNGKYYLSWGCFYAMADDPYGPYTYKGSIIIPETTASEFRTDTLTLDRHASFFEFHNQWYFICNDFSQPGTTGHFRNSILAYVHYRDNGEIAPIRVDAVGVGNYDVARGPIQAEDYFDIGGGRKAERPDGRFEVRGLSNGSFLLYPNVASLPAQAILDLKLSNGGSGTGKIEIRAGAADGELLGSAPIPTTGDWHNYTTVSMPLSNTAAQHDLKFVFRGGKEELARLDSWAVRQDKLTGDSSPLI